MGKGAVMELEGIGEVISGSSRPLSGGNRVADDGEDARR